MAIDLREFASGDTDYIAKMNANVATLESAINALQTQIGSVSGGSTSGFLMDTLFNHQDALIGPGSYKPTPSGTNLNIAAGGAYLAGSQKCVQSFSTIPLSFSGQPADTYYVVIDSVGLVSRRDTPDPGSAYSVAWNGSSFTSLVKLMPTYFDTAEAEAARDSEALDATFTTLDGRLEASENVALDAKRIAEETAAFAYELESEINFAKADPPPIYRKIGCSVDNIAGLKGAIQIDFEGTIVGWSVIADVSCSLTVEVDRKASSAPPAVPSIPNISTDKISASAPIVLSGAQSAAVGTAGVATWTKLLKPWDVIQFNVTAASGLQRATLYIRVLEAPKSTTLSMPHIASTADLTGVLNPVGPMNVTLS